MNTAAIIELASLGLRLASRLVERRAGKTLAEMNDDQIREAIRSISVRDVDDLIEEGRARARGEQKEGGAL